MSRKKRHREMVLGPEDGLATENFHDLNKVFYGIKPHSYLHQRWVNLLLARGKAEAIDELIAEGFETGKIKFRDQPVDHSPEGRRSEREAFVINESEVLLHHASETLLRFYLAHAERPACPWLEMARVRSFRDFKQAVESLAERLESGAERDSLRQAFFGSADRLDIKPELPAEAWEAGTENVAQFLGAYAATFLDPYSYNAAKHGLALNAGESSIEFGDADVINKGGPAVEYLAVRKQGGRQKWVRETKWIDLDRSASLTWMALRLIDAIWVMAQGRYLGDLPESLSLFDKPTFAEFEKAVGRGEGIQVEKMAISLIYYDQPA